MFQAYTEGHHRVLNSLSPPVVARFIRLEPRSWQGRASAQVQVRGCPVTKLTPRSSPPGGRHQPPVSQCIHNKLHLFNLFVQHFSFSDLKFLCAAACPTESPSIKVNMGTPRPSPSPTPTDGAVLVETRPSMNFYHPLINLYVHDDN